MASDAEYTEMLEKLEEEELMTSSGVASDEVYEKMLALYLLKNDTLQARLLWKRIPAAAKSRSSDLPQLWEVGALMHKRERAGVQRRLNAGGWGGAAAPLMAALRDRHRAATLTLLARAYHSVAVDDVARLTDMSAEQVVETATGLGWTVEPSGMLAPHTPAAPPTPAMHSGKQLHRLTQYVTFLEKAL